MADTQKYYYLKLKDDFFNREEIRVIETMDSGYEFVCILMKIYLKSLKRGGLVTITDHIPYDAPRLARVLGHKTETVQKAISIFKEFGLIDVLDSGEIYAADLQLFIGQSSTEADRQREYRQRIENQKLKQLEKKPNNAVTNVTSDDVTNVATSLHHNLESRDQRLESRENHIVEKSDEWQEAEDLPLVSTPEPNGNKGKAKRTDDRVKLIIGYLNEKYGSRYLPTTGLYARTIKARLAEGYDIDDFKKATVWCISEWADNPDMSHCIRPETIFSGKMGSYVENYARKKQRLEEDG